MTVDTKLTRNLGNNYVQVEASSKKSWTRYFKVPEDRADEFCASYKNHDKKMKKISNVTFVGAPFLGCILALPLTSRLSGGAKVATGILAGAGMAVGSVFMTASILEKRLNALLKKYDSEELFYDDKKFPV
ncbi:MAG: hypothetical protein NC408_09955 [Candidatus Gastranaerophilales bacterium]|nr:hypothetical protein [Candidatus Gastranaerophilales bacterium]